MRPHFLLTFGTILGRTRTLRVNNANDTVTDNMVRSAMDTVIGSQTVAGAGGRVNAIRRASIVETQVTPIDIA